MNIIQKLKISSNPNYIDTIQTEKLTEELIMYAVSKGYKYSQKKEGRYIGFEKYILHNLNNYPEYRYFLLEEFSFLLNNQEIRNFYVKHINEDFELLTRLLLVEPSFLDYYDNFKQNLNEHQKIELYNLIIKLEINYTNLPENLKNNNQLGLMYLKKNFSNIKIYKLYNDFSRNINEVFSIFMKNYDKNKDYVGEIIELFSVNILKNIYMYLELINKLDDNFVYIEKLIEINPNIINYLNKEIINNHKPDLVAIIMDLIRKNKYILNEKTPKVIIECFIFYRNYMLELFEKDFSLINLFSKCIDPLEFFNDSKLYDICKKNSYELTKDSPELLKYNFPLLIDALKNSTIKLEDIDLRKFLNFPVNYLIQIVDVAVLHNTENEIINEMKEKIVNNYYIKEGQRISVKDYNNAFDVINALPKDVTNIYINDKYILVDVNKIIEKIKKSGRKLNIILPFKNEKAYETNFLKSISDKDMVMFESKGGISILTANELLKIDETLDLIVKEFKDSNLSQYEKYVAIYNIVKGIKKYKFYNGNEEEDREAPDQSRNIYLLMQNDFIVCAGYANLLENLLNRVGIPAKRVDSTQNMHALAYVNIVDKKYGIDGYFKCDITNDNCNDILNDGYYYIHENPGSPLFSTDADDIFKSFKILKRPTYLSEVGVYDLFENLDPEFYENFKDKELTEEIKNMIKLQIEKKSKTTIPTEKLLDAIMQVKQYVYGEQLSEEDLRKEKNMFLLNNRLNKKFQSISLVGYNDDIKEKEKILLQETIPYYLDLIHGPRTYDKICFKNAFNRLCKIENTKNVALYIDEKEKRVNISIKIENNNLDNLLEKISELGFNDYKLIPWKNDSITIVQVNMTKNIKNMFIKDSIEYLQQFIFKFDKLMKKQESIYKS